MDSAVLCGSRAVPRKHVQSHSTREGFRLPEVYTLFVKLGRPTVVKAPWLELVEKSFRPGCDHGSTMTAVD